jgi:hypothetical protein
MSKVPSALSKEDVWSALVQTAHALLMYNSHKRYLEEVMLKEKPEISPQELAIRLSIPLGEALVLLSETRGEHAAQKGVVGETAPKSAGRSLLDYTK